MNSVNWIDTPLRITIAVLYDEPDICMHFYIHVWLEPMWNHLPCASKDLYCIGDLKFDTLLYTLYESSQLNYHSPLHHNCRIVSESLYLYAFLHALWPESIWIQHPSAPKDLYRIRDLTCDNILTQFDELRVHIWMHFLHGSASKDLYCIGDLTFDESDTVWWIPTIEITLPWKHNWHIVSETWHLYAFLHIFMMGAYGNTPPLYIKRPVLYRRSEICYIVVHLIWIQSIE